MDPQFPPLREKADMLLYCTGEEAPFGYTSTPTISSGETITFKSPPVRSGYVMPSMKIDASQGLTCPTRIR
jgi:hypothetical protein